VTLVIAVTLVIRSCCWPAVVVLALLIALLLRFADRRLPIITG
jgi:hypothetical protein